MAFKILHIPTTCLSYYTFPTKDGAEDYLRDVQKYVNNSNNLTNVWLSWSTKSYAFDVCLYAPPAINRYLITTINEFMIVEV